MAAIQGGVYAVYPKLDAEFSGVRIDGNTVSFLVSIQGFPSFVRRSLACLRRLIIENIPVLAINRIDIRQNTSPFVDETILNRLVSIPILSPGLNRIPYPSECDCNDYCETCTIQYELDVENNTQGEISVYSGDLKPIGDDRIHVPIDPGLLITPLRPGQALSLIAYAVKGYAGLDDIFNIGVAPTVVLQGKNSAYFTFTTNGAVSGEDAFDYIDRHYVDMCEKYGQL